MTIKSLCLKIPDQIRSELLLSPVDPIHKAVNSLSDPNMKMLADVWQTYIEPNKQVDSCPICLDNIRKNFLQMHNALVELENDYQYLKQIE